MERIDWEAWRGEASEDMALVLLELGTDMDMALAREIELVRRQSHATVEMMVICSHGIMLTFAGDGYVDSHFLALFHCTTSQPHLDKACSIAYRTPDTTLSSIIITHQASNIQN